MRCGYCPRPSTIEIHYKTHVWTRGWRIGKAGACIDHHSCRAFTSLRGDLLSRGQILRTIAVKNGKRTVHREQP